MHALPLALRHTSRMFSHPYPATDCEPLSPLPCSALSSLEVMELSYNALTSTLPAEWSVLRLAGLWLEGNPLQGTLPPEYSALRGTLESFGVGTPFLSGSLPPQWSALSRISYFDATNCQITGTLPPQFRWPLPHPHPPPTATP